MKTTTLRETEHSLNARGAYSAIVAWLTAGAVFLSLCNTWWDIAKDADLNFTHSKPIHRRQSEQAENFIDTIYTEIQTITDAQKGEIGNYQFLKTVTENKAWASTITHRQAEIEGTCSFIESRGKKIERQRQLEEEIRLQAASITCDPTDIRKSSNLTLDQLEWLVKGTWLEGEAETLYKADTEGGVNAFYLIAISTLESGRGGSPRAVGRHNYYGLETTTNYQSFRGCTEYFTEMMHRLYFSNDTIGTDIHTIGPVYCPPNPAWASTVTEMAMAKYKAIMDLTEN